MSTGRRGCFYMKPLKMFIVKWNSSVISLSWPIDLSTNTFNSTYTPAYLLETCNNFLKQLSLYILYGSNYYIYVYYIYVTCSDKPTELSPSSSALLNCSCLFCRPFHSLSANCFYFTAHYLTALFFRSSRQLFAAKSSENKIDSLYTTLLAPKSRKNFFLPETGWPWS